MVAGHEQQPNGQASGVKRATRASLTPLTVPLLLVTRVGGRRPVVDDDKRAVILARRARGESIRTIAAGGGISIGVVHKTLTKAPTPE